MSYVVCEGIHKTFGSQNVLENISLAIHKGEFISFLGPSGSGKTTLLRILSGLERQDRGSIYIGGKIVNTLSPQKRGVGFVFQHYALFPHLNVWRNISYGLDSLFLEPTEKKRRLDEGLQLVCMEEHKDKFPSQLSGGQQQRVALARALVMKPDVLLLDEPLGALDRRVRYHLRLELKRIHQETGLTMIMVTHDHEEAFMLGDRVAVLNEGRIEQIDTPQNLQTKPINTFVASFISEVEMIWTMPKNIKTRNGENTLGLKNVYSSRETRWDM